MIQNARQTQAAGIGEVTRLPHRMELLLERAQTLEAVDPVSYTHLRAHETVLDLVCRLLLEKKQLPILHCFCVPFFSILTLLIPSIETVS